MRIRSLLIVALLALVGCSSVEPWHPVTTEESQRLAATRFHNFDSGTRPFHSEFDVQGTPLTFDGWIDFLNHIGYTRVTGPTFSPQTLMWVADTVSMRDGDPGDEQPTEIVTPSEADGWQVRELDGTGSGLDALLIFLGSLASDRPDNPLLLQQAGALWLRDDVVEVDGEKMDVSVFSAPVQAGALGPDDPAPTPEDSVMRLWVDQKGLAYRIEALVGNQWITVDLGPATGKEIVLIGEE